VAHDDRQTLRLAGRQLDGEGLGKFVFRQPPSDLFIDFAQQSTDVFPGPAIVVRSSVIRARRRVRFAHLRVRFAHLKENEPFAVQ